MPARGEDERDDEAEDDQEEEEEALAPPRVLLIPAPRGSRVRDGVPRRPRRAKREARNAKRREGKKEKCQKYRNSLGEGRKIEKRNWKHIKTIDCIAFVCWNACMVGCYECAGVASAVGMQ